MVEYFTHLFVLVPFHTHLFVLVPFQGVSLVMQITHHMQIRWNLFDICGMCIAHDHPAMRSSLADLFIMGSSTVLSSVSSERAHFLLPDFFFGLICTFSPLEVSMDDSVKLDNSRFVQQFS